MNSGVVMLKTTLNLSLLRLSPLAAVSQDLVSLCPVELGPAGRAELLAYLVGGSAISVGGN
jgi:hypothetical protein